MDKIYPSCKVKLIFVKYGLGWYLFLFAKILFRVLLCEISVLGLHCSMQHKIYFVPTLCGRMALVQMFYIVESLFAHSGKTVCSPSFEASNLREGEKKPWLHSLTRSYDRTWHLTALFHNFRTLSHYIMPHTNHTPPKVCFFSLSLFFRQQDDVWVKSYQVA